MSVPVLFAVDEDAEFAARGRTRAGRPLCAELPRRLRVLGGGRDGGARGACGRGRGRRARPRRAVAQRGRPGASCSGRVRDLHAHAQRGLLIEWGSWGDGRTAEEIFQAMARRQIEYYVIRPKRSPDELFHQSVSTFLLEWAHARRVSPHTVHIVSESWTGRAHELKEVLGPLRGAARVPARRFARRPRAGGRIGRRRAASPGRLPERHRPRGPDQPGAGERHRRHDRPRPARVRRHHRRRRAGRPLGGGLRRLGGLPDAGRRRAAGSAGRRPRAR